MAKKKKRSNTDIVSEAESLLCEIEAMDERRHKLADALVAEANKTAAPLLEEVKGEKKIIEIDESLWISMDLYQMALFLDKENENAEENMGVLKEMMGKEMHDEICRPPPNHDHPYDVIVVGAGASGIGVGLMLTKQFNLDPKRVLLVERGEKVGESFRRWPKEMRFISPSFNNQGWTYSFDLNSVAYQTSPAYTLQSEHPTGEEYAHYLHELAVNNELSIRYRTQVSAVRPITTKNKKKNKAKKDGKVEGGFEVDVAPTKADGPHGWTDKEAEKTTLRSRYVIWAAGEFQYPQKKASPFLGSNLCSHNSSIRSWKDLGGDDFVVIGGYESGMDAVHNLTQCGKRCTVVSSTDFWQGKKRETATALLLFTWRLLLAS